MAIYIFTVPLIQLIEFILEETDNLKAGSFNFRILTRLYIIIFTISAVVYIQSFALSFRTILPFMRFRTQLLSVLLLLTLFNLVGFIIRLSGPEFGVYSEFESYQLVFI